jgi:hypothetical protein
VLALETWIAAAITLACVSACTIVVIVVAPWRSIRREPPLDDTAETRILLGHDPAAIAKDKERDEEEEEGRADIGRDLPGPAA